MCGRVLCVCFCQKETGLDDEKMNLGTKAKYSSVIIVFKFEENDVGTNLTLYTVIISFKFLFAGDCL